MINKCKKCGRKLTKERVVKIYEDRYRVWCACGKENFYYKELDKKQEEVKENGDKNKE